MHLTNSFHDLKHVLQSLHIIKAASIFTLLFIITFAGLWFASNNLVKILTVIFSNNTDSLVFGIEEHIKQLNNISFAQQLLQDLEFS